MVVASMRAMMPCPPADHGLTKRPARPNPGGMVTTLARARALALLLLALPAAAQAAGAPPAINVWSQSLLSTMAGFPAGFDVRASDPDGEAVTLTWAFDDGATATGEHATHAWATPGTHTATVTATDPTGLSDTRTFTIEVTSNSTGARPITGPPPGWVPPNLSPKPEPALADTRLVLSKAGSVAVRVTCKAVRCTGTVALVRAGKQCGRASFSVRPDRTGTAYVRVSRTVAKQLRKRASVAVVITVAVDGADPITRRLKLRTR